MCLNGRLALSVRQRYSSQLICPKLGRVSGDERSKVMSLRLTEDLGAELAAVARADGMPISEAIRKAIEHYIEARRSDQGFRSRLKKLLEEDREILERFTK